MRAQPTPLIGRAGEVTLGSQILQHDDVRLLTLTGTAGVGKTRLALAIAAALLDVFRDGVFFVDLARIQDASLVAASIAEALRIREAPDEPLPRRLEMMLYDRNLLLVLDNFEHLLPAADQVADLLAASPGLKVIATSRAPLRLRWEHVFPVRPLALAAPSVGDDVERVLESPAVQLFVNRAHAADPGFELTRANAGCVADVCARLDGIPLAIELAAARARHLAPELLLARLDRPLDILVDGARDLPARHRTLRQAISYSYELLSSGEQAVFGELAVFPGGCTAGTVVAAVAHSLTNGTRNSVLETLEALVDKSVIHRDELPNGDVRFRMLETIREYALDRLEQTGCLAEMRSRWVDQLLEFTDRSRQALLGREQVDALDGLEREHDNLRGALRWCIESGDAERGLQLAAALWRFWNVRGLFTEGRMWLGELLALPGATARTAIRANALSAAGDLAYNQGDDRAAESLRIDSLAIWRELGDRRGVAEALETLGALAHRRQDCDRATALLEESLLVRRESQDRWGIAAVLHHLGDVALEQGHFSTARARFDDSLVDWLELGDIWSVAAVLESCASLALVREQPERALRLVGAASALRERLRVSCYSPVLQLKSQRVLQTAQDALGRERASAALAAGQAMDLEASIDYARRLEETRARSESSTALPAHGPLAWLTPREREVAALLLRGLSNRHIAEELVITERTAETHVCRILSKLGLDSRAQMAAWLMDNGLAEVRARAS